MHRTDKLFSSLKQQKLLVLISLEGIDGNMVYLGYFFGFSMFFRGPRGKLHVAKSSTLWRHILRQILRIQPLQMKLGSVRCVYVYEHACLSLIYLFSGFFKRRFTEYWRKKGRVPPSLSLTSWITAGSSTETWQRVLDGKQNRTSTAKKQPLT